MANTLFRRAGALVALAALAACGESTKSILIPDMDANFGRVPANPSPTLGVADIEFFEVCKQYVGKVGPAVTVDVFVDRLSPTDTSFTVTLADGQCRDVWLHGGLAEVVTVTEQPVAGYTTSYEKQVRTRTSLTTDPVASGNSAGGNVSGNPGEGTLVRFINTEIPPTGELGNFVWIDTDGNGRQDSGEPGIPGVTVTLSGDANATTTTDANGYYLFSGLYAGNYVVTVGAGIPAGYTPTTSNVGSPDLDSNGSPASATLPTNSSSDLTIDFGYVPPPTGEIGNFVWVDSNGNGRQDSGEPGIPGVTVTLSGAANATTTTDANGYYLFSGLSAGNYTVTVGAGLPAGYTPTTSNVGTPDLDSNGSPASVTLPTNSSSDLTIDFGYVVPAAGCTYTQGYWKNHSLAGPAPYDAGWKKVGPLEHNTPFFNSGKTWLALWNTPPKKGNAYIKLAHQYMAAKLNVLNGASAPANVLAAITTAETYFSTGTGNISGLDSLLDDYNNGLIGPGHCD